MAIYRLDVYRTVNIGVFMRTNEKFLLLPTGLAPTKTSKFSTYLGVEPVKVSVGGSRLIGPLSVMNSKGVLLSRLADDWEVTAIEEATGLPVERLSSRYTAIGNLLAVNDKGAIASEILSRDDLQQLRDVLDVQIESMSVANYTQVGSMIVVTNTGAIVQPTASDSEVSIINSVLGVSAEPGTVNGGVPFVASGVVANSRNAVVGSMTMGPELMILSRAFKV